MSITTYPTAHATCRFAWRLCLGAGLLGSLAACNSGGDSAPPDHATDTRPNVLIVMVDDVGFSDIGAFGSEIPTPHIDALAAEGRVLTQFRTAAICGPTRAMLMSGADHHAVGVGNNPEVLLYMVANNSTPFGIGPNRYGLRNLPQGYEGFLNERALAMPELFRDAGYHTYLAGKWHLALAAAPINQGGPLRLQPESFPAARGFQQSFALMNGAGSHWAPRPSDPEHQGIYDGPLYTFYDATTYVQNDYTSPQERTFRSDQLPTDFYSTFFYTQKIIDYIDWGRSQHPDSRTPFFAFLSHTAPHWPLHAPQSAIDAQKGRYDAGYQAIRQARLAKQQALGLVPPNLVPAQLTPCQPDATDIGSKCWDDLNADEQAYQARAMEVYAAMISLIDAELGRLIQHLKDIGEYDNTLILLASDNGPDDTGTSDGPHVDNSLDNLGLPGSQVGYGLRWAEVSATPWRRWKGRAGAEGAYSVPAIVRLPGQTPGQNQLTSPVYITDVLPTLLDAAGISIPGDTYAGRAIVPIDGVSQLANFQGDTPVSPARPHDGVIASEVSGITAFVLRDNWKLSRLPADDATVFEDTPWQLFDLNTDRGETVNLANSHPDITAQLIQAWDDYAERNQVIVRVADEAPHHEH